MVVLYSSNCSLHNKGEIHFQSKLVFSSRKVMESHVETDLNCSPLTDVLKAYKACPTLKREMGTEKNQHHLQLLAEKTRTLVKENQKTLVKDKA